MPKSQNGSLEDKRLRWLVERLNEKDSALLEGLNIDMKKVDCFKVAGGRGKHYDMTIHFKDGTQKTIEHKGITG